MKTKALLLILALAFPFFANSEQRTVRSDEGDQGAALGRELLQQAPRVTHDPRGGERGAGTLTIEGVGTIGVNEIAPGADRSQIDALSERARRVDRNNAQQEGAAALRSGLQDQSSSGQALRAMVESEAMPESQLAGGAHSFWEASSRAVIAASTGTLSGVFADCTDQVELRRGPSIVVETHTEHTCEINEDNSPRCGRQREVIFAEIGRNEESATVFETTVSVSNRTASDVAFGVGELANRMRYRGHRVDIRVDGDVPAGVGVSTETPTEANGWRGSVSFTAAPPVDCPPEANRPPGSQCLPPEAVGQVSISAVVVLAAGDWYREQIIEGPGNCLQRYVEEFGCPLRFECASEVASLDGRPVNDALAARLGMRPLYAEEERVDGARSVAACAVAEAIPFCTVCANDDDNTNCVTPDVRQARGRTCGSLEADTRCRETQPRSCILHDENNPEVCVTWSRKFTCTDRVASVPELIPTVRNSCDLPEIPCFGDGCRPADELAGDTPGTSIQQRMAGLAIAQAMATDAQRVSPGSGQPTTIQSTVPVRTEGFEWGYDQDDGEAFEAEGGGIHSSTGHLAIDTSGIQVFRGRAHTCKRALGGLIRCCQPTRSDANQRYWNIFANINRGALATELMSREGPSKGSWAALAGGGSLSALSQALTSGRENVTGGGTGGATGERGTMVEIHDRFMAEARTQIRPNLSPSWACSQEEFDLAVQREIGSCSFAGTFCRRRVFGVCLETRESYCCYSSPMSKMLRAHADGGTIRHGNPRHPNCSGLTLDQMASVDWDSLDFTPLISNMQKGGAFPTGSEQGDGAIERFTGAGATAGGSGRVNVVDRTAERLGAINVEGVFGDIREEAAGYVQRPPVDITGPAVLSFSTTYHVGRPGETRNIVVTRSGSAGSASSVVALVAGASAVEAIEGAAQSWAPGDTSFRILRVRIAESAAPGTQILIRLTTSSALGAVTTATLEVIE